MDAVIFPGFFVKSMYVSVSKFNREIIEYLNLNTRHRNETLFVKDYSGKNIYIISFYKKKVTYL